jgi:type I restriction enzyme R subunit
VNRLHDGKDFGFILDYYGVLENLDHALDLYAILPEFDEGDLAGTLTDVASVIRSLPQKHSVLWDLFAPVMNRRDEEEYERLLADDELRAKFYERFTDFARALSVAMSSSVYYEKTPQETIDVYNRDLKFFFALRTSVRRRYAEVIDFSEYEPKIRKLVNTYVGCGEVEKLTNQVNIFDQGAFASEVQAVYGEAAKADTIAHRTMRTIEERMPEDPAFYKKFSRLLEETIQAFREGRIKANEYLGKVTGVMQSVVNRSGDDLPAVLKNRKVAQAYFGTIQEVLASRSEEREDLDGVAAEAALGIEGIVDELRIVNWTNNQDQQNRMRTRIEDYLFELKERTGLAISFEEMDAIMDNCIDVAKVRVP